MVPLCCIMMIICWAVEVISLKFARSIGLWFREGEEGRLEREEIQKQKEQSAGVSRNDDKRLKGVSIKTGGCRTGETGVGDH